MALGKQIRAGAAYVEITLRDSKLVKGLAAASKRLKDWSASIRAVGVRLLALGSAAAAPFGFALKAASDMEVVMNKFGTVFDDQADEVKAWSDQFASQVGRSKRQIADFMSATQDLFVPLGFDRAAATDLSKTITGLALDMASFDNKVDLDVLRDLHSALTGAGNVMKKYGVILNDVTTTQEAAAMGFDVANLTEQEKVQARLSLIMRSTADSQGDITRNMGSFANQTKALRANVEDTAVTIGTALLPIVTPLVTKLSEAAKIVATFVEANQELVIWAAQVALAIAAGGVAAIGFSYILGALGTIISSALAVAGALGTAISLIGTVAAALVSPLGIAVAAVAGLVGWFLHSRDVVHSAATYIGTVLTEIVSNAKRAFGAIGNALAGGNLELAAEVAWSGVLLVWEMVSSQLLGRIDDFVHSALNAWTYMTTAMSQQFIDLFAGVNNGLTSLIAVFKLFGSLVGNIGLSIGEWFGADVEEMRADLNRWADEVVAQEEADLRQIHADSAGARAVLDSDRDREIAERDAKHLKRAQDRAASLAAARKKFDEAVDAAEKWQPAKVPDAPGAPKRDGIGDGLQAAIGRMSVVGTYSAGAVRGMGGGSDLQAQQLAAQKKVAANTDVIKRKMPDIAFA